MNFHMTSFQVLLLMVVQYDSVIGDIKRSVGPSVHIAP